MVRQEAEVVADSEKAAGFSTGCGLHGRPFHDPGKGGRHGIEEREGKDDAGAAEKLASGKGGPGGNVRLVHTLMCLSLFYRRRASGICLREMLPIICA